jgi:hypothetical protein
VVSALRPFRNGSLARRLVDFVGTSATMLIMWEDPIVTETRALRQEMMDEAGNDLDALFAYLQKE